MLERYGFIVKADNYNHSEHKAKIATQGFSTNIICVSNDEEAVIVAKEMVEQGIQVIELCGGFGKESAELIITQVDAQIPIGYVTFDEPELQKLKRVMAGS
ncbi:conserved hypothetical protein [Vibrio nigripulchritudo SO65]|uniref:DUF6506 family protein n=1 Tax=Vibrio nigripulchritudo TaxID=28173 RepID=UPI0003B1A66A|nr:DUF6506 family protein [Vibrio nigripulchritudo]CCN34442.1 conserved hypothetical protein [Vibrio nigripulchritudo AM115]CCN43301.1 conserved hypothetical protein [Vibrio nigripulchritudo FTn2]CCN63741.1 conserved hypothetical protein [Vibrio nigripulchritudo POn4]CCN77066.1 conserved hypothetical protein [Vibrio nigripulchritudo SO65]